MFESVCNKIAFHEIAVAMACNYLGLPESRAEQVAQGNDWRLTIAIASEFTPCRQWGTAEVIHVQIMKSVL